MILWHFFACRMNGQKGIRRARIVFVLFVCWGVDIWWETRLMVFAFKPMIVLVRCAFKRFQLGVCVCCMQYHTNSSLVNFQYAQSI